MKTSVFLAILFLASTSLAQEPDIPAKSHLQILSGVVPNPVDIFINGKLVFPDSTVGQRITAMELQEPRGEVLLIEKQTGKRHKLPFVFKSGSYNTLIVAGDFQPLDPQVPGKGNRIVHRFVENKFQSRAKTVTVNIVNGLWTSSVKVFPKGGQTQEIPPLEGIELRGLPSQLILDAVLQGKKRTLYLAQPEIVRNLALVFFPTPAGLGFKAMMEVTSAANAEEEKMAEQDTASPPGVP